MDCATLNRLIHDWELTNVEFKSRRFVQPVQARDLAAALTSLANRGGGYLIIGLDDKSHAIEAGSFDNKDALAGDIANINRDYCSPPTDSRHRYLTCDGGEVLAIEVEKRGLVPHAVVDRRDGQIAARTYYIRNNQGRQLVTDTELHQMFLNPDFPVLRRRFELVYFYQRRGLLEPYFPDLPPWSGNQIAIPTLIQRIGPVGPKEDHEKVPRALAEIFPYAVLSVIDRNLSGGWDPRIKPTPGGAVIEAGPESSTKVFTSDDIPPPPAGSMLADITDFRDVAKLLVFFGLRLPANTDITVRYDQPRAVSSLELRTNGVYRMTFDYSGGVWSVGLPHNHPHAFRVHPTVLKADDPCAWLAGYVTMEFELEFGDFGPRSLGDHYSWANRVFDVVEWELSWAKYLERLPNPYILRIDRNVRELLERSGGAGEGDRGRNGLPFGPRFP